MIRRRLPGLVQPPHAEADLVRLLDRVATRLRAGDPLAIALGPGPLERAAGQSSALDHDLHAVQRVAARRGIDEALEVWACRRPQFAQTVAGLRLIGRLGGTPAQLVEQLATDSRRHIAYQAELRAQATQALASAALLALLPVAMVALTVSDAESRRFLFATTGGAGVLVVGCGLDVVGFRWMRRICNPRSAAADRASGLVTLISHLTLATSAGLPLAGAVNEVGAVSTGPWSGALQSVTRQVRAGRPLDEALALLRPPDGHTAQRRRDLDVALLVDPLITALQQAARYGTPLAAALDRVGTDLREELRRHGDVQARRVPVRMLGPLVTCQLPAFVLLTVTPALVTSFRSLPTA